MRPRASSLMCVVHKENHESEGGSLERNPSLRLACTAPPPCVDCVYVSCPPAVSSGRQGPRLVSGSLGPQPRLTRRRHVANVQVHERRCLALVLLATVGLIVPSWF